MANPSTNARVPTFKTLNRETLIKLLRKAGLEIPHNATFYAPVHEDGKVTVDELEVGFFEEVSL